VLLVVTLRGLLPDPWQPLVAKRAFKLLHAPLPTTVKGIALHPLLPMFPRAPPMLHNVLLVVTLRGLLPDPWQPLAAKRAFKL